MKKQHSVFILALLLNFYTDTKKIYIYNTTHHLAVAHYTMNTQKKAFIPKYTCACIEVYPDPIDNNLKVIIAIEHCLKTAVFNDQTEHATLVYQDENYLQFSIVQLESN